MATVTLSELYVHLASNLATYITAYAGRLQEKTGVSGGVRRYANGVFRAVTSAGTARTVEVSMPYIDRPDLTVLEGWVGLPVMVRDPLGRKVWGVFFSLNTGEQPIGNIATVLQSGFSLAALSLSEEV